VTISTDDPVAKYHEYGTRSHLAPRAQGERTMELETMRLVIVESPFAGDIERNVNYARAMHAARRSSRSRSAGDGSGAVAHQTISPSYSRLALSVATVIDAVSRQRLTAAPSLSACALISLLR
jgi:hypothetical protein